MNDTNGGDNKIGGRGPTGRGPSSGGLGSGRGSVRQSFSHGRSKAVVVETKRKRILSAPDGTAKPAAAPLVAKPQPKPLATAPAAKQVEKPLERRDAKPRGDRSGSIRPTLSAEQYARQIVAIKQAKKDDAIRLQQEAEAAKRRAAEDVERKRQEDAKAAAEAARRQAEEAEIATREAREPEVRAAEPAPAKKVKAAVEAVVEIALAPAIPLIEERPARPAHRAPAVIEDDDERGPARGRGGPGGPGGAGAAKKPAPSPRARIDDKRRTGRLTISKLGDEDGGRQRSMAAMRRRQERDKRKSMGGPVEREKVVRDVRVPDAITVQELANRMAERVADVIKSLMKMDIMATQNESLDPDTAQLVIEEFGHKMVRVSESDVENVIETDKDEDADLQPRAPVVTIMGHVDHGKTSLLDALRKTNVVAGEAGGITQHIGAYQITTDGGHKITFLDTPGHAAFTSMRARGAQVTDIVILVVAADDSVMPQTVEAIRHAKAANVPMIVAINKIDTPGADPQKVRTQLLQHEVLVEAMSGDVLDVEVSAKTGEGLDKLVEAIVLQTEILELKANPNRPAEGAVIEAKLDVGRGPVATVLVQRGTLKLGDIFVVGEQWGRVRALVDDQGERIARAGPSIPVAVLGLQGTPEAGDTLNVVEDENKAREIANYRQRKSREAQAAKGSRTTLDQLLARAKAGGDVSELPIVIKADVQGSAEAIVQALDKIGNEEVRVRILHSGVGAITESDVTLADASGAPIIGFNVRANTPARESANQKGVEIRYYSIIYDLVDDVKQAASGLLRPEVKETFIGYARIKEVFKVSHVGKVAGCEVTEGIARRSAGVRLLRDDVVIHEGKLKTLKRFKDEVKEVKAGQECGMAFENYDDIREKDVIEIFEREEIERTL
jgi:translation initiation factor IF-2